MAESNQNDESIQEQLAKIELFQAKCSEAFSMMAKSLSEMNEKLNVVLEILNTFSIMISEDDEDEDYDDDDIEDFNEYDDDDDEDDDDDSGSYDSDSTWVPEERDFWERENDD
jgi:hypothetical protein